MALGKRFRFVDKNVWGPISVSYLHGLWFGGCEDRENSSLFMTSLGQLDQEVRLLSQEALAMEHRRERAGAPLGLSWPSVVLQEKGQIMWVDYPSAKIWSTEKGWEKDLSWHRQERDLLPLSFVSSQLMTGQPKSLNQLGTWRRRRNAILLGICIPPLLTWLLTSILQILA